MCWVMQWYVKLIFHISIVFFKGSWLQIATTAVRFTVTDAFLISKYQSNNNDIKKCGMTEFADCVAWDLIIKKLGKKMPPSFIPSSNSTCIPSPLSSEHSVVTFISVQPSSGSSRISAITTVLSEVDGHRLEKVIETEVGGRLKQSRCSGGCNKKKVLFLCSSNVSKECQCFTQHKKQNY